MFGTVSRPWIPKMGLPRAATHP